MSWACVIVFDEDSPEFISEEDFNDFEEAKEYILANKERKLTGIELDDHGDMSGNILSLRENSGNVVYMPDHPIIVRSEEHEADFRKRMGLEPKARLKSKVVN
jgi:hypothetical protein